MMDDVMCIHCNSMHVRIKAKRPNSTSYKCKHCNEYFSTSHVVDTSSKHVIEEDQNTKKIKTDYKADAASVAPTATEVLNDFGLDPAIWTPKEFWLKETQKGNEADGLFSLYNISAKVIRKTAIHTDIPAIQPVKLSRSARKNNSKKKSGSVGLAYYISDIHAGYRRDFETGKLIPFHDRRILSIILTLMAEDEPDEIILAGDILDFPELTDKFLRTPDMYFTMQPAIIEMAWFLQKLREASPSSRIIWLEGNHEARLPFMMQKHLISAYCVSSESISANHPAMSIPSLMNLDALDIEWIGNYPDNTYWINDNIQAIHGNKSKSRPGQTADAYLENARSSVLFGHIHRDERASKRLYHKDGPKDYYAQSFGMTGNPEATPAASIYHDWQQGFGKINYQVGDGGFEIKGITCYNNREAIVDGVVYEGEDYTEQLRDETQWGSF